jgi:hypothetical protein
MGGRKQKPLRYIKGLGLQFVSKGSEWGLASMGKKHMQGRVKKKKPRYIDSWTRELENLRAEATGFEKCR